MKFIVDIIKGIFVGIANVIPGVSGGTMAVSFGIYDKILSSVSNLFKDFKKSFRTLFPIAIGMIVGVIGFTFIIGWLLKNQPLCTSLAFTGLIVGGVPMILKSLKDGWVKDKKKSLFVNIILFLLFLAIAVGMSLMNGDENSGVLLTADLKTIIVVFFIGIIAAATMIIPGVSGSLVLMILGYYFGILSAVKDFISALKNFDMKGMISQGLILAPFAIGCLVGVFFIAKLVEWLFNHFASATFSAILGLIFASPIAIFYKVQQEYNMFDSSIPQIIFGIIIFVVCTYLTILMGKLEGSTDELEKQE
ncbi:MAG: DUF368 domain-containing protein [Lachnospiraceae bacterium]|nr:DUF368 domain-containing protein [Lachnospiraceae bacterium]